MKVQGIAFLCLLGAVAPVLAQDHKMEGAPAGGDMEAMMKAISPGPQHKQMARMAGNWTYTIQLWMEPGKPPTEANGAMHSEMILDGRYVQSTWTGDMMGMPFEGHGLDAYDNMAGRYTSTWVDNMGTGIMVMTGSCDDTAKVCKMVSGETKDPMSGQMVTTRSVVTWTDEDHFKNEMFTKYSATGNEVKSIEIVATRKK
jgi:hypothetical protein